ncbi:MAG: type II secretion system F family protein [Bryobacteraceae bacterium]|nr:type II secretion system F family protein [Bryobacteraceae bacterium]
MLLASLLAFFLAAFGLTGAAVWFLLRRPAPASPAANGEQTLEEFEEAATNLLRSDRVSSIGPWESMLQRFHFAADWKSVLAEADLSWSVGRLAAMMLLTGTLVTVALWRLPWMPMLATFGCGLLSSLVPYFRVMQKRKARLDQFEQAFPDALDSLARALRAGHPLAVGLDLLASESPAPISTEMRRTLEEWKLGRTWDQALDHLSRRVPTINMKIFVAAVRLQSRSGGKLTEVLGTLSESMRESLALEGEVRAISAHGRMTGAVLTLLPVGIAAMMFYVNPPYLYTLTAHPWGKPMLMGAAGCLVLAHFVIRRILDIRL